ncbi:MAG: AraC family transcriptional regulator [Spirochaetia bacterium]|jgi:AraC-like DNA-binding protein/mannose-6-phosphate isomerase-like protein (cupin superfamily)|nr:AraC family transcriptional regulator [Spirochaetia bacterium]
MKVDKNYFYKKMPNAHFGVDIFPRSDLPTGTMRKKHWHEHMQLYAILSGKAFLECGAHCFQAVAGDIAVINSNELHYLQSLSNNLHLYIIRIDLPFLFSNQVDQCQTKFLAPLSQDRITFHNLIHDDKEVSVSVTELIREYGTKDFGYELAVKSSIYKLIVLLLRTHVEKILSPEEFSAKTRNLRRFEPVLQHIDTHYTGKITIAELAAIVHMTVYHFCRMFKQLTGKTMTDYLNGLRLEKSTDYLAERDLNITEIALECGFDSVNYYSRLFRRYYHVSPTEFRKHSMETPSA